MAKIIGNTTAMPNPRPDWAQTNENKADFIKNKPTLGALSSKNIIEKTDLAEGVQESLNKADSALQAADKTALQNQITSNAQAIAANTKAIADQATSDAEKYETKTDASAKLTEAKQYADGKDTAIANAKQAGDNAQSDLDTFKTTVSTTYATKSEVSSAIGSVHTHDNKTVLDGIDATKVSAWDNAEKNAKSYADGLAKNYDASGSASAVETKLDAYKTSNNTALAAVKATADGAVQDITTGSANGTISVDGADVAVKGLGSAAYTASTAYATAAQGAKADSALQAADKTALQNSINTKADNSTVTTLAGRVTANETAISTLNGTGTGSVDKKIADAINKFATDASSDGTVNTYKELIDYAASHGAEFTELVGVVDANTKAIATKSDKTHSHTLTPTTVTVVKEINAGSGSFTPTTKYLHPTTASAAPNSHTHNVTVSGTTGANSGNAVTAVTSVGTLSGGSGSLTSDNNSSNGIKYVDSVTHTAASLTGTKTFNTDAIKDVTLSASATSTAGPQYVESISGSAPSLTGTKTFVTAQGSFSGGSGDLVSNDTVSGGIPYIAIASYDSTNKKLTLTTKYLHHTHTAATLGAASTGTVGISGGSYSATTKYMAHSNTAASTASVGISGGSITPTTKYLHHTHTGASLSGTTTGSVAPSGHTHSYGSSTALTTGANSGSAVSAITGLAANTTAATGDITYVESATHTHTGASVKSTETVIKSVDID